MKLPNILFKRIVIILIVLGSALSLLYITYNRSQPAPAIRTPGEHKVPQYSRPARLMIPKIDVDAAVKPMGLTPEGDMQSPSKPQDTGWYKFGAHPGEKGSAVIAGHYGRWDTGESTVFNELKTLVKGDTVYVKDDKGATATFVVRESKVYTANDKAEEVFHSSDKKAHLNLITCQGTWSEAKQTYSHRLVIFADKWE